jgi:hypothetical protein
MIGLLYLAPVQRKSKTLNFEQRVFLSAPPRDRMLNSGEMVWTVILSVLWAMRVTEMLQGKAIGARMSVTTKSSHFWRLRRRSGEDGLLLVGVSKSLGRLDGCRRLLLWRLMESRFCPLQQKVLGNLHGVPEGFVAALEQLFEIGPVRFKNLPGGCNIEPGHDRLGQIWGLDGGVFNPMMNR